MKQPFDIDLAFARIREAVKPFPRATLSELFDEGFDSPFELLVSCIISIRTLDEVSLPCSRRLFALARSPEALSRLPVEAIDRAIGESAFHEAKAVQIQEIARRVHEEFGGTLPCEERVLLSFRGVGPKCANLVLGIGCHQPRIGVDVHVHRVTNRWGYVQAKTPEKSLAALEAKLPVQYWVEINRLLVPFGKHICTGRLPHCSTCPVLEMCRQVGVASHR